MATVAPSRPTPLEPAASTPARTPLDACDRVGARVHADGPVVVENRGRIEVGDDTHFDARLAPVLLTAGPGATVTIGADVRVESGVRISARAGIRIGDGVRIGPHAVISDEDGGGAAARPIVIEAGALLGAAVHVAGGVTIGARATVPAGAVLRAPAVPHTSNGAGDAPRTAAGARRCRGVVIADFTAEDVARALRDADDPELALDVEVAPYGQVTQTLHALAAAGDPPDFALVWTRPDEAIRGYRALLDGERPAPDDILSEVDEFAARVRAHARAARFLLVASWAAPPDQRGLGMLDLRPGGAAWTLARMNQRLADGLAGAGDVFVLDAGRWVAAGGLAAVRPKLWFLGKVAFGSEIVAEAAADVRAAVRGALGMARKLLVLDLDDTLWGGIVGDVGKEGLRLGGHDAVGEAYVEFQRRLLALARRGVALAVVSKNEEQVALDAMRSHPEMLIRPEQLAAHRISWRDKAEGVAAVARELNLGLQSVVFIDDNPVERDRVRQALPEVLVPEWPVDPTAYPLALARLRCFDTAHVGAEDAARNAGYAMARQRAAAQAEFTSMDAWLRSLETRVRFERLAPGNAPRATQLLNKTNQMNLRTRRLSEAEYVAWAAAPGHEVWAAYVSDRFGDSGLTGLVALRVAGAEAHVEDFVLSCRVMGRTVEDALVWAAVGRARLGGATTLVAEVAPTPKNVPCQRYWAASAFERDDAGAAAYRWPVTRPFPAPPALHVEGLPGTESERA